MTEPNVRQIPLSCSVCMLEFSGPVPAAQHFQSRAHKKKEEVAKKSAYLKNHCALCNVACDTVEKYGSHIASPAHKKNEDKSHRFVSHPPATKNGQHLTAQNTNKEYDFDGKRGQCYVCKIDLTSKEHATQHMNGAKHKKAVDGQKLMGLQNVALKPSSAAHIVRCDKRNDTQTPSDEYYFNGTRGRCNICAIELTSIQHANDHLSGSKHSKAKNRYNMSTIALNSEKTFTYSSEYSNSPLPCRIQRPPPVQDEKSIASIYNTCNEFEDAFDSSSNCKSTENIASEEGQNDVSLGEPRKDAVYNFDGQKGFCKSCKVTFTSKEHAEQHLDGRKHKRYAELWKLGLLDLLDVGLHCKICMVSFTGPESAEQHFSSLRHQKKAAESNQSSNNQGGLDLDENEVFFQENDEVCNNLNQVARQLSNDNVKSADSERHTSPEDKKDCLCYKWNGSRGYCIPCKVDLTSEALAQQHLVGKKHKKAEKAWRNMSVDSPKISSPLCQACSAPVLVDCNTIKNPENSDIRLQKTEQNAQQQKSSPISLCGKDSMKCKPSTNNDMSNLVENFPALGMQQVKNERTEKLVINSPNLEQVSNESNLVINSDNLGDVMYDETNSHLHPKLTITNDSHDSAVDLKQVMPNLIKPNMFSAGGVNIVEEEKKDSSTGILQSEDELDSKNEFFSLGSFSMSAKDHSSRQATVDIDANRTSIKNTLLPLNITQQEIRKEPSVTIDLEGDMTVDLGGGVLNTSQVFVSDKLQNVTECPSSLDIGRGEVGIVNEMLADDSQSHLNGFEETSTSNDECERKKESKEEEINFDDDDVSSSEVDDVARNLEKFNVNETKLGDKTVSFEEIEVQQTTEKYIPDSTKTATVPSDFSLPENNQESSSHQINQRDSDTFEDKETSPTETKKKPKLTKECKDRATESNTDDEKQSKETIELESVVEQTTDKSSNDGDTVTQDISPTATESEKNVSSENDDKKPSEETEILSNSQESVKDAATEDRKLTSNESELANDSEVSEEFYSCQSILPVHQPEKQEIAKHVENEQVSEKQQELLEQVGTDTIKNDTVNVATKENITTDKTSSSKPETQQKGSSTVDSETKISKPITSTDKPLVQQTEATRPSCRPKENNPYPQFKYYCPDCNQPMNSASSYIAHLDSKGHRNKVSNAKAPLKRSHSQQQHLLESPEEMMKTCTVKIPRSYQEELYSKTMKVQDSVCFLPTGTGKTLISCMVVSTMLERNPTKQVLFLVDRALLVIQQSKELQAQTMFTDGEGECHRLYKRFSLKDCESGGLEERHLEMAALCGGQQVTKTLPLWKHDIIVVTAAYCENLLVQKVLRWSDFSLVVFDEAHHCMKNHPFNKLLRHHHLSLEPENRPKIMGLTASPAGQITVQKTAEMLVNLLRNMGGATLQMVEENADDLKIFKSNAKVIMRTSNWNDEEVIFRRELKVYFVHSIVKLYQVSNLQTMILPKDLGLKLPNTVSPTERDIRVCADGITNDIEYFLNNDNFKNLKPKLGFTENDLECFCTHIRIICIAILSMEEAGIPFAVDVMNDLIEPAPPIGFDDFQKFKLPYLPLQNLFIKYQSRNGNMTENLSDDDIKMMSTVSDLSDTLTSGKYIDWNKVAESGSKPMVLVLVKLRGVAHLLCKIMQDVFKAKKLGLQCVSLVGHGGGSAARGMRVKQQKQTLNDINQGKYDVIFATPVCEEGIDISACEAVVSMHPPTTVTAMVQLRGRARKKNSYFIIMCKNADEEQKLKELVEKEKNMITAAKAVIAMNKKKKK